MKYKWRLVISDLISFPLNIWKNLTHHLAPSLTFQGTMAGTYGASVGCLVFLAMRLEDCGDPSGYVDHLPGQT